MEFEDQLEFGPNEEGRWGELFKEIDNGNVIPVIGPDLLVDPKEVIVKGNKYKENLHQQLISYIAEKCHVGSQPRTFSQLIHDKDYKYRAGNNPTEGIYYCLNNLMGQLYEKENEKIKEKICNKPSKLLQDLLGTKKFPFVITTSFTPVVEKVMEEIWGTTPQVRYFNNNPSESMLEGVGDIKSINDMLEPTIYYMFGKHCGKPHQYVVTDSDMMNFCGSWIKGAGVPRKLAEALKTKQLLILGNNYSDWLFRFVWFCLRNSTSDMKSDAMLKMSSDTVVKESAEQSFKEFIEHLNIFFQKDPSEVIDRISKHYENVDAHKQKYSHDVFISYSRRDLTIAQNLADMLTAKGCKVWFDNSSIKPATDWDSSIEDGIDASRFFVPILSKNVEKEALDEHVYRLEWKYAAKKTEATGKKTYIIPFAEKGFDFGNETTDVPVQIQKKQAICYSNDSDVEDIACFIVSELKNSKDLDAKFY